jgi:hypothetical protein
MVTASKAPDWTPSLTSISTKLVGAPGGEVLVQFLDGPTHTTKHRGQVLVEHGHMKHCQLDGLS